MNATESFHIEVEKQITDVMLLGEAKAKGCSWDEVGCYVDSTAASRVLIREGSIELVANECSNLSPLHSACEDDNGVEREAEE